MCGGYGSTWGEKGSGGVPEPFFVFPTAPPVLGRGLAKGADELPFRFGHGLHG